MKFSIVSLVGVVQALGVALLVWEVSRFLVIFYFMSFTRWPVGVVMISSWMAWWRSRGWGRLAHLGVKSRFE